MVADTPLLDFLRMCSTTGFSAHVTIVSCIRTQKLQTSQCAHVRTILVETRSISAYCRRYSTYGFSAHVTPLMNFLRMGLRNRIFCVCFFFRYMHAETPDLSMCAYAHNRKRVFLRRDADIPLLGFLCISHHCWIFCVCDLGFRYMNAEIPDLGYFCVRYTPGFSAHLTPLPDFPRMLPSFHVGPIHAQKLTYQCVHVRRIVLFRDPSSISAYVRGFNGMRICAQLYWRRGFFLRKHLSLHKSHSANVCEKS